MKEKYTSFFQICGFPLDTDQEKRFEIYLSELKRWGQRINLTAIDKDEEIIKKLFLGSLSFSVVLNLQSLGEVMDYGSGAGFPGLPLKIRYPHLKMTLLEANTKKWAFLKYLCRELGLVDCLCLKQRGEELIKQENFRARYSAVLSRAVGHHDRLLDQATFLLAQGGICVFTQGLHWQAGRKKGLEGERKSMIFKTALDWHCPALEISHRLLVYERCST